MSGPKSGAYSVGGGSGIDPAVAEAQRQERELRSAQTRAAVSLGALVQLTEHLRAEVRRRGDLSVTIPDVPSIPAGASASQLQAMIIELDAQARALRADAHAARTSRRLEQVGALAATTESTHRAVTADVALAEARGPTASELVVSSCREVLASLRDDVDADAHADVDTALARVGSGASVSEQRRWLTELRRTVDVANQRARSRASDVSRVMDLLADVRSSEHRALEAQLQRVLDDGEPLTDALVAQAREAVTAVQRDQEAAYVATSIGEVLEELGYEVGPGFDSLLAGDGFAHVRGRGEQWRDHGIRIRIDPDDQQLHVNVVGASSRTADAQLDELLERSWCEDLPTLLEELAARGVEVDLRSRLAPGELPVLDVPAEVLEALEADAGAVRDIETNAAAGESAAVGEADERRRRRRRAARRTPRERGR